ncbi:hypothetical protein WIW50_11255 [Flavobacteriaceae bacterium 3-367]|uniref:hypothetical protein n=1 Tax=Eudoraea algarum TaxID=3417568 RepID=UPI00326C7FAF
MVGFYKFFLLFLFFGSLYSTAQEKPPSKPSVQDLDFLIGTWQISFSFYDTHKPERGVIFTETGTQECRYDMELNGVPMFITCEGEVTVDSGVFKGRTRSFREAIRYSSFIKKAFERIGLYSNWPATALETLSYNFEARTLEIRGELDVQKGLLERYEDIYRFNANYTEYTRTNVANFSDMPITEFNLTVEGQGAKLEERK